ncbi:hypothetical protein OpiT1DRAFT_05693 [Opitutaceae bacterium TAV1]|nr:hypothetical protein OpiT1DRAFT_05693 [Opitutaceae bacterium TAV1]
MPTVISFKKTPVAAPATAAAATSAPAATSAAVTPAPVQVVAAVPAAAQPVQATPTTPPATTAVAPATETALATEDQYNGLGGFEGEFDSSEMRTPYLSIVGKTSKLFDEFPQFLGQFVYNKSVALGEEIRVVFVRASKVWVEDLPFGSEVVPQTFKRMEDARAAGFLPTQLKERADLDLLIELDLDTEGVDEIADLIVGTKAYLLARYTVQSTAYGKTVPVLMADTRGFLKGNLLNGFYKLSTLKIEGKKGTYYTPQLKTDGPTSPELRTEIVNRCAPVAV